MQNQPQRKPPTGDPEGCVVVAIRIPVRALVFLVVVPVRLLWDASATAARLLGHHVLAPLARAVGRLLHGLLVVPLIRLHRHLLTPLGHALLWLHARVLTPVGHALVRLLTPVAHAVARLAGKVAAGLYRIARVLLVLPALAL
ncbi:hypothetical protein ABZ770_05530 [Streptomyces sp. NPDC006654]|uniref:hypothetical protein n=1 Tax=unclassified Streptomyces TaxID=2593676 RepID=UPI0033DB807A